MGIGRVVSRSLILHCRDTRCPIALHGPIVRVVVKVAVVVVVEVVVVVAVVVVLVVYIYIYIFIYIYMWVLRAIHNDTDQAQSQFPINSISIILMNSTCMPFHPSKQGKQWQAWDKEFEFRFWNFSAISWLNRELPFINNGGNQNSIA